MQKTWKGRLYKEILKEVENKEKEVIDMFELVVIWETGEKEVYAYSTEERAEHAGREMKKAFGNQIAWTGTRKRRA